MDLISQQTELAAIFMGIGWDDQGRKIEFNVKITSLQNNQQISLFESK